MRLRTLSKVMIGFAVGVVAALAIMTILFREDLALIFKDHSGVYRLAQEETSYGAPLQSAQAYPAETAQGAYFADERKDATVTNHYVLIGDSRTRGMNSATNIAADEHFDVIAESNMGYSWMMQTALPQAAYLNCDNYVILLGVNDPTSIESYLAAYRDLIEKGVHLTLVTIGPVEEKNSVYTITNNEIRDFNERLYEVAGARVIDLYDYFVYNGFHTLDGVHYDNDTYRLMQTFLLTELE